MLQIDVNWNPPSEWTGPIVVLYEGFDRSDGLVLMEGNEVASDPAPLVPGKVRHILFFKIISMKSKTAKKPK